MKKILGLVLAVMVMVGVFGKGNTQEKTMTDVKLTTRNIEYLQGIQWLNFGKGLYEPVRASQIATYLEKNTYSQQKTNAVGFKRMTTRLEDAGLIEVTRKENLDDWEINITTRGIRKIACIPRKLSPIYVADTLGEEKNTIVLFETPIGNVTIDLD